MKKILIGIVCLFAFVHFIKNFYILLIGVAIVLVVTNGGRRKHNRSLLSSVFRLFSNGSSNRRRDFGGSFGSSSDYSPIRSINDQGGKRFGSDSENDQKKRKELEDEAYFYRRNGGPRWKIEAADKQLGRSQWESDYYDDKYGQ